MASFGLVWEVTRKLSNAQNFPKVSNFGKVEWAKKSPTSEVARDRLG